MRSGFCSSLAPITRIFPLPLKPAFGEQKICLLWAWDCLVEGGSILRSKFSGGNGALNFYSSRTARSNPMLGARAKKGSLVR